MTLILVAIGIAVGCVLLPVKRGRSRSELERHSWRNHRNGFMNGEYVNDGLSQQRFNDRGTATVPILVCLREGVHLTFVCQLCVRFGAHLASERACFTISTKTLLVSLVSRTSCRKAMRVPRMPSAVFKRT